MSKDREELEMVKSEVRQFLAALDKGYFPGALAAMTIDGKESSFLAAVREAVEE